MFHIFNCAVPQISQRFLRTFLLSCLAGAALLVGVDSVTSAPSTSMFTPLPSQSITDQPKNSALTVTQSVSNTWQPIADGPLGNVVNLVTTTNALYVQFGTTITTTDPFSKTDLMQWKNGSWSNIWPSLAPPIADAALGSITVGDDGILYCIAALKNNTDQVVGYNGTDWFTVTLPILPPNPDESGYEFSSLRVLSPTELYLTGSLYNGEAIGDGKIAVWNGNVWTMIDLGLKNYADKLQMCGEQLYFVAWSKWYSGYVEPKQLYTFDGGTRQATAIVLPYDFVDIETMACLGADMYFGGRFLAKEPTDGSQIVFEYLVRWDGVALEPISITGTVAALAVRNTTLYVGGQFSAIGGVSANNIARWNGALWQPLGDGVTDPANNGGQVATMAVSGDDLYVGGAFQSAGGQPARSIAIWHDAPTVLPQIRLFLPYINN